jgi:hypothetical protein
MRSPGKLRFGDEAERRTRFDPTGELLLVVRRDEDDRRRISVRALDEPAGNVEAAFGSETDVEKYQIGMQSLGESHCLIARTCDPHDR